MKGARICHGHRTTEAGLGLLGSFFYHFETKQVTKGGYTLFLPFFSPDFLPQIFG